MGKNIDTQYAAEGQPLNADIAANPSALTHLQQSISEGIADIVKGLIGANYSVTTLYRLWGVGITQTNDGFGNFTTVVTPGAIFYNGEIFEVDSSTFIYGAATSTGLDTAIVVSYADPSGIQFDSGLSHQVLVIRKIVFSAKTTPTPPPLGLTTDFNNAVLPKALPSTPIIVNRGSINGETITFVQSQTRLYNAAATNGFSFTLDFTNAMPGAEVVITTPISSVTTYSIGLVTGIGIIINPPTDVLNTHTLLNYRFKVAGIDASGTAWYTYENYAS